MNTDNTNRDAEPSPASAGSHGKVTVSLHTDDSACAFPDSRPIRRQRFTLTDEEREAVEASVRYWAGPFRPHPHAAVLGKLLEELAATGIAKHD
jgi:hypothetical protein